MNVRHVHVEEKAALLTTEGMKVKIKIISHHKV